MQGGVCLSDGFYSDAISAGLKSDNAKDMAFIYSDNECEIASIYYKQNVCSTDKAL